jgi:hypothetical protein
VLKTKVYAQKYLKDIAMVNKIVSTSLFLLLFIHTGYSINGPQRLLPAKNSIVATLDPVFSWKPLTRTGVEYEIKIGEDKEFIVNVIQLKTAYSTLKLSLPYLQKGKSYYWTIRALYTENQKSVTTDWSHEGKKNTDHFQFIVSSEAFGFVGYQPVIVNPSQNSVSNTLQPEFKWLFPDHSELRFMVRNVKNEWVSPKLSKIKYQLMLSASDDFTKGVKTFEMMNDSMKFKLTIPWLNKGSKYFWKVKAIYLDPEKGITKESEWSTSPDNSRLPASFEISKQAKGVFGFNEGQIEELFDKSKLNNVVLITTETSNCFSPAVSKDGQKLAYCSDRLGQVDIYEISLADQLGGSGSGSQKTTSRSGKYCFNPFWLPGYSQVALYSNKIGEYYRLFNTTTGTGFAVLDEMDMDEDPEKFEFFGSCTSDGKIVFTGKTKNSKEYDLYLLNASTKSKSYLLSGMFPDIGNDDRIVYATNDPSDPNNFEIWIGNLEANGISNPTIITDEIKSDYDPVFSPDGTRIAFTSTRSGNSDIWVMDSNGANLSQLTFHPLVDRRPQWINNESLVFQSNRGLNDKNEHVFSIFKINIPK